MQVLGSRRGRFVTLALAAVAFVAAAAFAVLQLVDRPAVEAATPAPGGAVAEAAPEISFAVPDGEPLRDLRVTLDGEDVTARARGAGGRVVVRPGRLPQGRHEVEVRFTSDNVFARTVTRRWSFDVDTVAPALAVAAPRAGALRARRAVRFAGRAEPGAEVRVAVGDDEPRARGRAGEDGRWTAVARLPEGPVAATVTAVDRAGNATARRRDVVVDTTPPDLAVQAPAPGEQLTATAEPLVHGAVRSDDPRALTFSARVNGRPVATIAGADAEAPGGELGSAPAGGASGARLEIDGDRFAMAVGALPQGRNRIAVAARDRAGNVSRVTTVVHVDTTEELGGADLVAGARGEDVRALQRRLRDARAYPRRAKITGVLDPVTQASLKRYQKQRDLPRTGSLDRRTRDAMVGRIVVTLSQFKLRLIRDGKVWKTYPIAIGQPAYPTPTGTFDVIDKQVDPAWYPPDSPWAAELETIPPGPGNPLGTRWIGISAPAIGIHGTYAASSIGTAASHGCMRMHIPDVEELFEEVSLGMQVVIRP